MPETTVEQKLVEHLKNQGLAVLADNRKVLDELAKKAIWEALFQPQHKPKQWGGHEETDSIVVAAARDLARKVVRELMNQEVRRMTEDPETMKVIRGAIFSMLPKATFDAAVQLHNDVVANAHNDAVEMLTRLREQGEQPLLDAGGRPAV